MGVCYAILACAILVIQLYMNPTGFFCSGIPILSFQLFVLSWWLWRFPALDIFRARNMALILNRPHWTPEQKDVKLRHAWRLQFGFVHFWGWFCALFLWNLATWLVLQGNCSVFSLLLLGGFFLSLIGWVIGGAGILFLVFQEREVPSELDLET